MTTTTGKKYGLILTSKKKTDASKIVSKPSVFGDSSSDEEDSHGKRRVNISLRRENEKMARKTHETVVKAMEEDPSVFEYDSLYDDMVERRRRDDPRLKKKKDTKPKYIEKLKRVAEQRKLEQDIIYERKVQKEVKQEEEKFSDKEKFVTLAYRKKLEERRLMEEKLRREAEMEGRSDVTKQKDLTKFYRHILHQQSSMEQEQSPPKADREEKLAEGEEKQLEEKKSAESTPKEESQEAVRTSQTVDEGETVEEQPVVESPEQKQTETAEPVSEDTQTQSEPTELSNEEKRKVAYTKRTGEEAFESAKERPYTGKAKWSGNESARQRMEKAEVHTPTYLVCCEKKEHSLFLRSTGTSEGKTNVIKGTGMDIELIPTEDDSPLPVPTAHHLCVITTPTQQQLNAISFDFQLYFSLLKTATLGRTVLYTPIISSTQTVFTGNLPFADSLPASLGTVCIAGRQTNGRGRTGSWVSPEGCLMFSLLLKFGANSRLHMNLNMLIYMVHVAMIAAVRDIPGYEELPLCIKWPNDTFVNCEGQLVKVGGKMIDRLTSQSADTTIANVGCGLNITNRDPTTCLNDVITQWNEKNHTSLAPLKIEQVLAMIMNKLELYLTRYETQGLNAVESTYYKYWIHSGLTVRLATRNNEEVVILGIDRDGSLKVRTKASGVELSLREREHRFDVYRGVITSRQP